MANSTSVSFATYNILNPFHAVKWGEKAGLNASGKRIEKSQLKASTRDGVTWKSYSNWDERIVKVCNNIQYADIVCLQEIATETLEQLQQLTGYRLAHAVYHSSERAIEQYGNAILYRAEHIVLREAFEIKYENEQATRLAACAIFEVGGRTVGVASVHLKGYNRYQADRRTKQQEKTMGFEELKAYVKGLESHLEGVDGVV